MCVCVCVCVCGGFGMAGQKYFPEVFGKYFLMKLLLQLERPFPAPFLIFAHPASGHAILPLKQRKNIGSFLPRAKWIVRMMHMMILCAHARSIKACHGKFSARRWCACTLIIFYWGFFKTANRLSRRRMRSSLGNIDQVARRGRHTPDERDVRSEAPPCVCCSLAHSTAADVRV